jgi:hypothetical protein
VEQSLRQYSTSTPIFKEEEDDASSSSLPSSPFAATTTATTSSKKSKRKHKFIPRKAAVQLTDQARTLFRRLLETKPDKDGILLDYHQSSSGQPRMVFSFRFVTKDELIEDDEG